MIIVKEHEEYKKKIKQAEINSYITWHKDVENENFNIWNGWIGKNIVLQIIEVAPYDFEISVKIGKFWTDVSCQYSTLSNAKRACKEFVKKIRMEE